MTPVYINKIMTANPPYDIHDRFVRYIADLMPTQREKNIFLHMVDRSQIHHRYSFLQPDPKGIKLDANQFYQSKDFASTDERMVFYKKHAFTLARLALDQLNLDEIAQDVTHIIITSCTGFYAPGIDLEIMDHYHLKSSVERTIVGFMGCQAGINALKLSHHIVRSCPQAKIIILNIELCTLHLQDTVKLEEVISFLLFADGCAASLISAEPYGIEMKSFQATVIPNSRDLITWHIQNSGFNMMLSRQVPALIASNLADCLPALLGDLKFDMIQHWAIHPGGRSILDAVKTGLDLPEASFKSSRKVLQDYGNMSSSTIMFVLKDLLTSPIPTKGLGCALAFGPGLTAEGMIFDVI